MFVVFVCVLHSLYSLCAFGEAMKIEIKEKSEKELKFELSDTTTTFANLLRRYAIGRVPTFAIDDVTFYENNTSFFDEYIAHRLGLIPLTTPTKVEEGEEVSFMIESNEPGVIYSRDMKSTSKEIVPVSENIPIIKLREDQSIRLEAKAILGVGAEHAKWQPGIVSYGYDEEGTYRFIIESFGQMSAKDILKIALKKIEENATDIAKQLEKVAKETKEK